jgi:hypothetical protein
MLLWIVFCLCLMGGAAASLVHRTSSAVYDWAADSRLTIESMKICMLRPTPFRHVTHNVVIYELRVRDASGAVSRVWARVNTFGYRVSAQWEGHLKRSLCSPLPPRVGVFAIVSGVAMLICGLAAGIVPIVLGMALILGGLALLAYHRLRRD